MHTLTLYQLTNVHSYRIDLAGRERILFDSIDACDPNDSANKRIVCPIPGQQRVNSKLAIPISRTTTVVTTAVVGG